MANNKLPAMMFYTGDWLKEPALTVCSPSTRGIWIDMLCIMHEQGRTGAMTGKYNELAKLCRCSMREMKKAVEELKKYHTCDVTFCNGDVTIINRRMANEHNNRYATALRVRQHRMKQRSNIDVCIENENEYIKRGAGGKIEPEDGHPELLKLSPEDLAKREAARKKLQEDLQRCKS